jgi:hypothetical protein
MQKITKEIFLERYKEKFGYEYSGEFPDDFYGRSLIEIKCNVHGILYRSAFDVLGAHYPCQQCGKDARANSNRKNNEKIKVSFAERVLNFQKVHGDLYEYPEQEIKNGQSKINVICRKHGEYIIHMHSHDKGVGCPKCRVETTKAYKESLIPREIRIQPTILANKKRQKPKEEIEILFREMHGDKFQYDWSTYNGKSGRIKVICPEHGETIQIVGEHLKSRYGCRFCANYCVSDSEKEWIKQFEITESQKVIPIENSFFKVDGYNLETNTVYEYLGDYWHGHPSYWNRSNGINHRNKIAFTELFEQTQTRLTNIMNLGYNIIYAWESDKITRIFRGKLEW